MKAELPWDGVVVVGAEGVGTYKVGAKVDGCRLDGVEGLDGCRVGAKRCMPVGVYLWWRCKKVHATPLLWRGDNNVWPYMHWPHLNHGPFGLAIPFAPVRLHVTPGQLQVEDGIEGLLIEGLCFMLTTCMYFVSLYTWVWPSVYNGNNQYAFRLGASNASLCLPSRVVSHVTMRTCIVQTRECQPTKHGSRPSWLSNNTSAPVLSIQHLTSVYSECILTCRVAPH